MIKSFAIVVLAATLVTSATFAQDDQGEKPRSSLHLYYGLYALADLCAQAQVAFTDEQVQTIADVAQRVAAKSVQLTQAEKDKLWQTIVTSIRPEALTEAECYDALGWAKILVPQDLLYPPSSYQAPF